MKKIITIDGPASSGKSTITDILASKLKFKAVHSGLIYRAVAFKITEEKIEQSNFVDINNYLEDIYLLYEQKDKLQQEKIASFASKLAQNKIIRNIANKIQISFSDKYKNVIVEGRDAGTEVFPDALIKFYITATAEVRALRRYNELQNKGIQAIYDDILKNLTDRDKQDSMRVLSPLRKAKNSITIDTSNLDQHQVVDKLFSIIQKSKFF